MILLDHLIQVFYISIYILYTFLSIFYFKVAKKLEILSLWQKFSFFHHKRVFDEKKNAEGGKPTE